MATKQKKKRRAYGAQKSGGKQPKTMMPQRSMRAYAMQRRPGGMPS